MRTKKNQIGDWVAVPVPGGERPAKILEVRTDEDGEDRIRVRLRFENGERDCWFDAPYPRIRWQRQNGRPAWSHLK